MSDESPVTLDATREGLAVLRLNRPEKHNAFNPEVIEALNDHLDEIRGTPTVRAVLLEGAGTSFSAGADVEWMRFAADYTRADNVKDARALADMLHKLHCLDAVTIALVNGAAMGGGLGLIAACDVAIAVKWAEFRFSEVRLGLIPATISPYVVKAIGPRWARMLFATGKAFDTELALKIGLIHGVSPDLNALSGEAEKLVDLVFHAAPGAVKDAKRLVDDVMWRELDTKLRHMTADRIADRRASTEGREGLSAYLEKRKPSWAE
jgi:methylglutaconyl-CoA hydratase